MKLAETLIAIRKTQAFLTGSSYVVLTHQNEIGALHPWTLSSGPSPSDKGWNAEANTVKHGNDPDLLGQEVLKSLYKFVQSESLETSRFTSNPARREVCERTLRDLEAIVLG